MNESRLGGARPYLAGHEDARPVARPPRGSRDEGGGARRHRLSRMWLLGAAAAAMAAGGVTAVVLTASGSPATSALATVTGALAATSADSYSFDLDTVVSSYAGEVAPITVSGAFDPRNGLGAEVLTTRSLKHSVRMQIRFVGMYVYTWLSPGPGRGTLAKPWNKSPIPPARANVMPPGDYSFVSDRPVSPAELSRVLLSAGTVRDEGSASGPGWTGTRYAFTARFYGGRESVTGTVYVDRQGRVRRLVTITTQGRGRTDRDLTFTGFGASVPVTAPPASQVQYTSTPYWGFYF